jgi:hypothetical protein
MKKTSVRLAVGVNRQPSEGPQLNLIRAGCNNQAIHFRNKFSQGIHRNILMPLSLGLDTCVLDHRGRGGKSQYPFFRLLHGYLCLYLIQVNAFGLAASFEAIVEYRRQPIGR